MICEKRKCERVERNSAVTFKLLRSGRENRGMVLNISPLGVAIRTKYIIPKYEIISIIFTQLGYNGFRTVKALGEVKYCSDIGMDGHLLGVAFSMMNEEDRAAIEEFVKSGETDS